MATLKEREFRAINLGNESDVFLLNEGCCPICKGDCKLIKVAGTEQFHIDYTFEGDHEMAFWVQGDDEGYIIGGLTFRCEDGHQHYIEVDRHGDWH